MAKPLLPLNLLSMRSKIYVITHSDFNDFKMIFSFIIIGNNAVTTLKLVSNVRTWKGWNCFFKFKEVTKFALSVKKPNGDCSMTLCFIIMQLNFVRIQNRNIGKYGMTIINPFLGTIFTTAFGVNIFYKNYFMHLSNKSRG